MAGQHVERAGILHDAVGLWRIDLDDVAAGRFEAAEPHQVLDVLRRIQILAGRQRRVVVGGDLGQKRVIERIARLLEPAQVERPQAARISECVVAEKFRVGVDRKRAAVAAGSPSPPRPGQDRRPKASRRLSSSASCSRRRDGGASRRANLAWSCPAHTSRRRHSRTLSPRSCRRCNARPAPRAAACRRSWPPRPTPRPRWCRCRSSARYGRRISRSSASRRGSFPARNYRRHRRAAMADAAFKMRGMNRARICAPQA